jgi:hypothetical protein
VLGWRVDNLVAQRRRRKRRERIWRALGDYGARGGDARLAIGRGVECCNRRRLY